MTDAGAHTVVVDFWSEPQCQGCRAALTHLDALRARYAAALHIRLHHFPSVGHRHAHTAAQAAEEAHAQGRGRQYVAAVPARTQDLAGHGAPAPGGRRTG